MSKHKFHQCLRSSEHSCQFLQRIHQYLQAQPSDKCSSGLKNDLRVTITAAHFDKWCHQSEVDTLDVSIGSDSYQLCSRRHLHMHQFPQYIH